MPIQILADEVASQIAAGEVVERPASVVKELVENALDAGAQQITIRIEGAGQRLIEVADDGRGIPFEEIPLAVARHATSKLRRADELFHIQTLGFRGEALASIASVSRFTLESCAENESAGGRVRVEGGRKASLEPAGVPGGTLVRVEDLFFNTPARLKFLKKPVTEKSAIDALVVRYALAYAGIRFQLFQDNKPVLRTSGNGDRREILAQLYDLETARRMIAVEREDGEKSIDGFISPVSLTRSNRKDITFFINGRWVQDVTLATALLRAYHTLLMVGRYPLAALFLDLPPEEVDVNVHPAKAEVRFRKPDEIFALVQRCVRRGLLEQSPVPEISSPVWSSIPLQPVVDPAWRIAHAVGGVESNPDEPAPVPPFPAAAAEVPVFPSGELPLLRLVGQVGAAYLVAEAPDGLYLIDQHAAHERVLFEKYKRQQETRIPSQPLLMTETVTLPPPAARLLEEELEAVNRLGFQVETFGPQTFLVRAVPVLFAAGEPAAMLRALVEDFEEDETPLKQEREARLIGRICKRMAVKAGKILSPEEQQALVRDLEACSSPRTCPHGRPTMIHLSVDLLERQFGRRGSR